MEEIKTLVEVLKETPTTVILTVFIYFMYKALIVGSVYGVIKYAVTKLHDYMVTPREKLINRTAQVDKLSINDEAFTDLVGQLERLRGITSSRALNHIFSSDVAWLKKAIDEKKAREAEGKQ